MTASPAPGPAPPTLRLKRPHRPGPSFFREVPNDKLSGDYQPFPMQRKIHYSLALYRVACLGRQVGKSELAAVEASYELCRVPGSKGWIVAPTFEQAEIIFSRTLKKVQWYCDRHPELKLKYKKGAKLEILIEHFDRDWKLPGAVKTGESEFKGKSGKEPDNLVGATLTYLIIDEAAVMDEEAWVVALEPMLSTTQGWVLFVSTPRGFNWFYENFMRGESTGPEDAAWECFNAPSWDANPTVPRSWYEDKKRKTPELKFRQEYGAEFVSNSGSVFQAVDKAPRISVDPALSDYQAEHLLSRRPDPRRSYVIGADFARLQDYTVYTVLDLRSREMVASYRYSHVDWERQLKALKDVSDTWNGALVVGDNNGPGDFLDQECAKLGIPFEGLKFTGTQIKAECINPLAMGLEQGYVSVQNDPALIKEMRLFKYNRTESGQLTMKAEGRNHDDRVISLALAYSKVEHVGLLPVESSNPAAAFASAPGMGGSLRAFESVGSLSLGTGDMHGFDAINASLGRF